jgi:hypothetical protein
MRMILNGFYLEMNVIGHVAIGVEIEGKITTGFF